MLLAPWKESYAQPRQHIKKQRHYFAHKGPPSHVWMWELDYKESWALKNWCFWPVVLEEIQLIHPKGDQSWLLIRSTDAEAEIPIVWPTDAKTWLIWKDPDAGKDWGGRRGWQRMRGLMASPTQSTWVWVSSRSWWWTERPGVLQSMGSQRVGRDWATELNCTAGGEWLASEWSFICRYSCCPSLTLPPELCLLSDQCYH